MFDFLKKKKDDGFSLDDYSLPSLGEEPSSPSEIPSLPDLSSSVPETPIQNDPILFPDPLTQEDYGNSRSTPAELTPSWNNTQTSSLPAQQIQPSQDLTAVHQDIHKAKLEAMEAKLSLVDARMSNMEQKLEMIYQLIVSEVSEDTKRKLKIDSMMGKIRNQ